MRTAALFTSALLVIGLADGAAAVQAGGSELGADRRPGVRTVLTEPSGVTPLSAASLWCRFVGAGGAATWPVIGDWNGDGIDGVGVVVDSGSGALTWLLRDKPGPGLADYAFTYGVTVDVPVTGDWDGNGKDGIGFVRQNGDFVQWHLRNPVGAGPVQKVFDHGIWVTDVPIFGDWKDIGRAGVGNVHADGSSLLWMLRDKASAGPVQTSFHYGNPATDFPLTGDFDGDGSDGPAFQRRPTSGSLWDWHVRNSNSAGPDNHVFDYGTYPTDCPVTGNWERIRGDGPGVVRATPTGIEWRLRNRPTTGPATRVFIFGASPASGG